jgi:hypothetical protein
MPPLLTDSTQRETPWESLRCSSSPELPCILRLQTVDYCATNSLPLVPVLRQTQSKFSYPIIFNTYFNIIFHLCLGFSEGLFLSGFQSHRIYAFLFPDT